VSPHSLDPNLTPQYVDEATLGFDWLLTDAAAVSLTGTYRSYTGVSRQDPDGNRAFYWTNFETVAHGTAAKIYYGAVLEFRKRPADDNLFLSGSVTYQNLSGFNQETFRDIYFSNPYQTEARIANYWGDVAGNNWIAKAQATYFFPNNWYLGIQAEWDQGIALSTVQSVSVPGYGSVTYYPNGRADMARLPSNFYMDIQFGIEQTIEVPFDIPMWDDTILLGIYADIYNVLSNQQETGFNTTYGSSKLGQPNAWRAARNYELGFRIEL
jgi:hypothetical protein